MKVFRKQPNDHIDYDIDFSEWLTGGDIITSVDVTVSPGIDVTGTEISDTFVKLWIDNGTNGNSYKFSILAYTQQGREKEVDFLMKVRDL